MPTLGKVKMGLLTLASKGWTKSQGAMDYDQIPKQCTNIHMVVKFPDQCYEKYSLKPL